MQSCPLLPGPISHFLLRDASLGPINRMGASSVWQRADVKEMKQWWGVCQMRMREGREVELCFLFVGIRLTDLYLVSKGPLASANPHHLQNGPPFSFAQVSNSPSSGLITLPFGQTMQTLTQDTGVTLSTTTTSNQRKRERNPPL